MPKEIKLKVKEKAEEPLPLLLPELDLVPPEEDNEFSCMRILKKPLQ
jgi:hypothetical protein